MQEVRLATAVRHPNLVSVLGMVHSPPCIVTEYCSRGSLTDVLQAAAADPKLAAQLTWPRRLQMVGVHKRWAGEACRAVARQVD